MNTAKLVYSPDGDFGDGWFLYSRNGRRVDKKFMSPSKDGRLLTHDILEHFLTRPVSDNIDELTALGCAFAHREGDFYNAYTGSFSFASDVGQELYYLTLDVNPYNIPIGYSKEDHILEIFNDYWKDVIEHMHDEYDYHPDWRLQRRLKAIGYRAFSRGYNHVHKVGQYAFGQVFYDMRNQIDKVLKRIDIYQDIHVSWSYYSRDVKVRASYDYDY